VGRRWSAPDFGLAGLAALWVGTSGGSKADQRRCKLRFSLAVRSWIGAGLTVGGFVFEGTVSSAANRNRLLWSVVARHHLPLRRRCLLGRAVLAGSGCRTKVKRASWLRCEKQESGAKSPHSIGRPSSSHSVPTPSRTITAKRLQTKAQGRAAHPGLRDHHRANPNGISQFARPVTFLVWNPVGVRRDLGHSLPRVALRGFAAALTLGFGLQRLRRKVTR